MEESIKYQIIEVAYRSRLLFRTDAEYREALGVSFETVVNNRESKREVEMYYAALSRETEYWIEESLNYTFADYIEASEFYLTLDWGDRSQLASKKKFCRMLYRIYATAGKRLTAKEEFKFRIKSDDRRLINAFFPQGTDSDPAVNINFIVLFVFGVIRPWSMETSRGRDIRDEDTVASLEKLRSLILTLKDDLPRLGSTEKPMIFNGWIAIIDQYLQVQENLKEATPLRLYSSLKDISRACRSLMIAENLRSDTEKLAGIYMPGIWIDDTDYGRNRFWIFPDNFLAAFCYKRNGMSWEMYPYEMRVRFATDPQDSDTFILVDPYTNLNYILSPEYVMDESRIAEGLCEQEVDEHQMRCSD